MPHPFSLNSVHPTFILQSTPVALRRCAPPLPASFTGLLPQHQPPASLHLSPTSYYPPLFLPRRAGRAQHDGGRGSCGHRPQRRGGLPPQAAAFQCALQIRWWGAQILGWEEDFILLFCDGGRGNFIFCLLVAIKPSWNLDVCIGGGGVGVWVSSSILFRDEQSP